MSELVGQHDYLTRGKPRQIQVRINEDRVVIHSGFKTAVEHHHDSKMKPYACRPGLLPGDLSPELALWLSETLREAALKLHPKDWLQRHEPKRARRRKFR